MTTILARHLTSRPCTSQVHCTPPSAPRRRKPLLATHPLGTSAAPACPLAWLLPCVAKPCHIPSHQPTWKCTNSCRKTTFLLERAFLNFHVSWEGSPSAIHMEFAPRPPHAELINDGGEGSVAVRLGVQVPYGSNGAELVPRGVAVELSKGKCHLAVGQKPENSPSEHPNPTTKIGSQKTVASSPKPTKMGYH